MSINRIKQENKNNNNNNASSSILAMDLYAILGIRSDATTKEIQDAFIKLKKQYKPLLKRPHDERIKTDYDKIRLAYATLVIGKTRAAYDAKRQNSLKGNNNTELDFFSNEIKLEIIKQIDSPQAVLNFRQTSKNHKALVDYFFKAKIKSDVGTFCNLSSAEEMIDFVKKIPPQKTIAFTKQLLKSDFYEKILKKYENSRTHKQHYSSSEYEDAYPDSYSDEQHSLNGYEYISFDPASLNIDRNINNPISLDELFFLALVTDKVSQISYEDLSSLASASTHFFLKESDPVLINFYIVSGLIEYITKTPDCDYRSISYEFYSKIFDLFQWRAPNNNSILNLSGIKLSCDMNTSDPLYSCFSGKDLKNINFSKARLSFIIFINSELNFSYFEAAKLNFCYFNHANLSNANFKYATLKGLKFERTNFTNVNLIGVKCKSLLEWDKCILKDTIFLETQAFESAETLKAALVTITENFKINAEMTKEAQKSLGLAIAQDIINFFIKSKKDPHLVSEMIEKLLDDKSVPLIGKPKFISQVKHKIDLVHFKSNKKKEASPRQLLKDYIKQLVKKVNTQRINQKAEEIKRLDLK